MYGLRVCVLIAGIALLPVRPANAVAPPRPDLRPLLDRLLVEYRALGLPLPPKGSQLARIHVIAGNSYDLAWLVKDGTGKNRPYLLCGYHQFLLSRKKVFGKPLDPTVANVRAYKSPYNESLLFALQAHSVGCTDLAREMLVRSREEPTRQAVRDGAWSYWKEQVFYPGADRREVARRLYLLMTIEPTLRRPYHQEMVKSVQAIFLAPKSKPGSIEAIIDELVEYDGSEDDDSNNGSLPPRKEYPWERLCGLYFEAVPVLIKHLDDKRLTPIRSLPFNNFGSWQWQVEHIVSSLLETIACESIGPGGFAWEPVQKADALKWLAKAKTMGEGKYALSKAFPNGVTASGLITMRANIPNPAPLLVIQKRYPRHLPELYRRLLSERPSLESDVLARAIARSSLPLKVKREALLLGYENDKGAHQFHALEALKDLDHPLFVKLLLPVLEKMPRHVRTDTVMAEGYLPCWLVRHTSDARVWKTLETATRKATVAARMDVLRRVGYTEVKDAAIRQRQLTFLASYLSDKEEAERGFLGRIPVRQVAALMMAERFGLPVPRRRALSPAEWKRLYEMVLQEWRKESAHDSSEKSPDRK